MDLKKTYRRSVVLSECYPRPQEPRRPRFPFFLSSQCQRTDLGEPTSVRAEPSNSAEQSLLPVSRQQLCPLQDRRTVGAASAQRRRLNSETTNFLVFSEACFSRWRLAAPRSSAMGGLYGRLVQVSTAQNDESDIF